MVFRGQFFQSVFFLTFAVLFIESNDLKNFCATGAKEGILIWGPVVSLHTFDDRVECDPSSLRTSVLNTLK